MNKICGVCSYDEYIEGACIDCGRDVCELCEAGCPDDNDAVLCRECLEKRKDKIRLWASEHVNPFDIGEANELISSIRHSLGSMIEMPAGMRPPCFCSILKHNFCKKCVIPFVVKGKDCSTLSTVDLKLLREAAWEVTGLSISNAAMRTYEERLKIEKCLKM